MDTNAETASEGPSEPNEAMDAAAVPANPGDVILVEIPKEFEVINGTEVKTHEGQNIVVVQEMGVETQQG